jgi:mono/diheme cytochrome c family protein
MRRRFAAVTGLAFVLGVLTASPAMAQQPRSQLPRGEYLATIMDCGGCHTTGALAGQPDPRMHLAGSTIGFGVPNVGVFWPPNLTSDRETGLGAWSEADIVQAIRAGMRPDGRVLVPVMPWPNYAALTDEDAQALARYLKNLPPIRHAVPPPAGANETPPAPSLTVVAPNR